MRDRQIINAHALRACNKYFFPGTPLLDSILLIQDQETKRGKSWGNAGMSPMMLLVILSILSLVLSATTTTTRTASTLNAPPQKFTLPLDLGEVFHNASSSLQSPSLPPNPYIFEYAGFKVIYTTYGIDSFGAKDTWMFISECLTKIEEEREALHREPTDEIPGEVIRCRDRKLGGGLLWMLKGTNELTYLMVEVALRGTEEFANAYGGSGDKVRACTIYLYDQLQSKAMSADGTLQALPDTAATS